MELDVAGVDARKLAKIDMDADMELSRMQSSLLLKA